jgi:putative hemolysin
LLKTAGLVMAGAAVVTMMPGDVNVAQLVIAVLLTWLVFAMVQVGGRGLVLPRTQAVALHLAPWMRIMASVLAPVATAVRRLGLRAQDEKDDEPAENVLLTEGGLRLLLNVGDEEDAILDSEKEMIESILEMDETVAREVMVPRIDMVAMEIGTNLRDALDIIIEAGHSRIPVYEENIDSIAGVLYAKDLLKCFRDNQTDVSIRSLLRPAYYVPTSKRVDTLLREMQKHHVHIAVVVDEYGGTAGLVTIEDIIEEIVGDIQDEYDHEEDSYVEMVGPGNYVMNARLDVYSVSKLLDVELPDEDADTLGGMIYSLLGHVPEPGEPVEVSGWRFTVLSLDGRRIEQVRAERIEELELKPDEETVDGGSSLPGTSSIFNLSTSD